MNLKEKIATAICTIIFVILAVLILIPNRVSSYTDLNIPVETTIAIEETETPTMVVEETKPEIIIVFQDIDYIKPEDKDKILEYQLIIEDYINYLYDLMPMVDSIKYDNISSEIERMENILNLYQQDYNIFIELEKQARIEEVWNQKAAEYPVATKIWLYLKNEIGLNDYVCAGIIGNMMAECGGPYDLDLDWANWDNSTGCTYYGICQWSVKSDYYLRYTDTNSIANISLDEQLELLHNSLEKEMNVSAYGNKYQKGFNYEQFCSMDSAYDAAIAFAKVYERCAARHVNKRGDYAEYAYNYFVLEGWN